MKSDRFGKTQLYSAFTSCRYHLTISPASAAGDFQTPSIDRPATSLTEFCDVPDHRWLAASQPRNTSLMPARGSHQLKE
jgi:hypothetical protein